MCVRAGRTPQPLVVADVAVGDEQAVADGILHCPDCQHEYPVISGIPIIVPELARLLTERGVELLLRDDLDPMLEGLVGDAIGPDSWFDIMRQVQSTYAWDGYADLDPAEGDPGDGPRPGAARRCLARLLALAGETGPVRRVLDIGCASGRTSFDLAAAFPEALVLGADIHLAVLRIAQMARAGRVSYPRRRIGLVYDRRQFAVSIDGAERTDFWACDALALPMDAGSIDVCLALNLLDCVPDPGALLRSLASVLGTGGRLLMATPYDWSTRATQPAFWLGGHSQRALHGGSGEAFLHAMVAGMVGLGAGLVVVGEQAEWPWQTRLHQRSAVSYRTHLVAMERR